MGLVVRTVVGRAQSMMMMLLLLLGGSCTISLNTSLGSRDTFRSQIPRASSLFDARVVVEPDMASQSATPVSRVFRMYACLDSVLGMQSINALAYVVSSFSSGCMLIRTT